MKRLQGFVALSLLLATPLLSRGQSTNKTATTNAWSDVKSSFDKGIDDVKKILP